MGWATGHITHLKDGRTVRCRPRGHSMVGKINSGQLCTIVPYDVGAEIKVGDIVLCRVNGRELLHLVRSTRGEQYQIGNMRGHINGWITRAAIYGRCIHVED